MNHFLPLVLSRLQQKSRALIGLFLCTLVCLNSFAQTTISTTSSFTNDTTVSTVTFNFQNTNSYPVVITNVEGIVADFGTINVALYYKNAAINGTPGLINTANGWTLLSSQSINGVANATNNVTQPFFSGISLVIPANTTYGIAVNAYNGGGLGAQRIGTAAAAVSLSNGGCNFNSGPNIGYASVDPVPAAPTLTARGWLGKITFINGSNCVGTPASPTISGPTNTCANALFSLTATGYSLGVGLSSQWQFYNTVTASWEDIATATNAATFTSNGITASTQYRLKTTCTGSGLQSLSNIITVGIGAGLAAGTYTINKNAPSTATNFISYTAAAAAMKCGITGLVTLNVVPGSGPYTERAVFENIPGTSAVNQIRLNGNGEVLQYANTNTEVGVLTLKGTKFITVDSVTVRSLGQDVGIGIVLTDTAKYDSLMHCFVDMRSLSNNAQSILTGGISLSDDYNTTANDYGNAERIYIGYNNILGGTEAGGPYYGIMDGYYYNYNQDNGDTGNVIVYNNIENFVYGGIMTSGENGTFIGYNDIHRTNKVATTYFMGIRSYSGANNNSSSTGSDDVKIIGNRIHNPGLNSSVTYGFFGIQVYDYWVGTNQNNGTNTLIANNAIYNVGIAMSNTGYIYGIYAQGGNYNNTQNNDDVTLIYHNTIDLSEAASSTNTGNVIGIYYYDNYYNGSVNDEDVYVKNNLITMAGVSTGPKYGFWYFDNVSGTGNLNLHAQRNNVYLTGGANSNQYFVRYNNVNYATVSDFQTAFPTQEIGTLAVNPQYTSPATGDFTPLNYALFGNGVDVQADVPRDILGRYRSTTPTPGAFEIAVDAGVSALISPVGTYCSSVKLVRVSVHNSGIITINNVQVNWSLNGVLQTPVAYTGTLLPNTSAVVSLGNGLFMPSTPVIIKAWTSMPNGQNDGLPFNDTLVVTTQSSTSVPINIGPDDTICTGNTLTLDAGYPGAVYVWDNLANTQLRTIQNAGTYYVKVTALDGCIGVDTMKLSLRPLPIVNLGPDREICEGTVTTFDAGHPGATYMWDDGSTLQTRTVDTAGDYEAQVTDIHGCTGTDNVSVMMKDMPRVEGINATHADSGMYTFYPLNPLYTISYRWNFGDGTPEEMGYMVQHQYLNNGIYTVTLYLEGECTGLIITNARTVDVFNAIGKGNTGINNTHFEGDISLYPNPANNNVLIENKSEANMNQVIVYNVLGQTMISEKADSGKKHQLNTSGLASGLYTIRVETDKGIFTQKFEVRR